MRDPALPQLTNVESYAWPVLTAACVASGVATILAEPDTGEVLRKVAWLVAFSVTLLLARSHPIPSTIAAALLIVVSFSSSSDVPPVVEFLVPVALAYWCGAQAPLWPGLFTTLALAVAIQIHLGFEHAPDLEIAVTTIPPWWCGLEVQRRRRLVRELREQTSALEREEEAFVRLSVERERARIARDLHDIVSHHLALIVVQAGAGRLARDAHAGRLTTIHAAGTDALADADRLLALLHPEADELARLAPLLERARELGAAVTVSPTDLALSPEVETVAHFIAREAITNAAKHAPGAQLELTVHRDDGTLTITAHNEGATAASSIVDTGSGLGLTGMVERAASVGGTVVVDRTDGFSVRAVLPLAPRTI
jgi:signal transduction histidine kinase